MAANNWSDVRSTIEGGEAVLGPYFGHQIRRKPRHLLFTLSRYKFAGKMLGDDRPLNVLELGCSEGIGTRLLAEAGHTVTGLDADGQAIAYAQEQVAGDRLRFLAGDIMSCQLGQFDAVVSLDVIEHIPTEREDGFLAAVKDNLTDDGFCILGTPNQTASVYASPESNLDHVNLYTADRLMRLMRRHFVHAFLFGANDEVIHTGFPAMCHYLMVLACMPRRTL